MAITRRINLFDAENGNNDAALAQTSVIANITDIEDLCIHVKIDGAPNGTLYLDIAVGLDSDANGDPLTWEEFDSVLFAAANTHMWLDKATAYTFARLRWSPTGGNGTLLAVLAGKGDR